LLKDQKMNKDSKSTALAHGLATYQHTEFPQSIKIPTGQWCRHIKSGARVRVSEAHFEHQFYQI